MASSEPFAETSKRLKELTGIEEELTGIEEELTGIEVSSVVADSS